MLGSNSYNVIVVDPPWPIKKIRSKMRPNQKTMDYPLLSIPAIKALRIFDLASPDSWVFLWTPQKFLYTAKSVLLNWGFKYLITGSWLKEYGRSAGMPLYGFRWNLDFYLVGYKGKKNLWPKKPLIPLGFRAANIRHSEKPDLFYKNLEILPGPRIDLFSRKVRLGWDCWGNEVSTIDVSWIMEKRKE